MLPISGITAITPAGPGHALITARDIEGREHVLEVSLVRGACEADDLAQPQSSTHIANAMEPTYGRKQRQERLGFVILGVLLTLAVQGIVVLFQPR